MTTSRPADSVPAAPSLDERIKRLRATCASLEDDLVAITVAAPSRRSARLLEAMQERLREVHATTPAATTTTTPTWIPAAPIAAVDVDLPEIAPATIAAAAAPAMAPANAPDIIAAPSASVGSTATSSTPAFTVLVGDAPPTGTAPTTSTPPPRSKPRKTPPAKPPKPAATAPSLRPGALLHGVLTALSAAATSTPLTLGLALTTTLTALFAGARRGLWSRLTQLAGLGTIASVVMALWPLGERLSWRRPVSEDELLLALPQLLVALQALRLTWKARGHSTSSPAPASSLADAPSTVSTISTTAPARRRGLVGLAVAVAVAVAVDFALLFLAMGPAWPWLWRSSRGWLALAVLMMAIVDRVRGRHGVSGVATVGVAIALAVVMGVGAWNLRFAMFHDVFSLARVGVAVVVAVLALILTARVIRRRHVPIGGPA